VPLLRSISHQVSLVRGLPLDLIPSDTLPLINHFISLLSGASTPQCPLFIFLDSLDLLSPADGAHLLAWFPASRTCSPGSRPHFRLTVSSSRPSWRRTT